MTVILIANTKVTFRIVAKVFKEDGKKEVHLRFVVGKYTLGFAVHCEVLEYCFANTDRPTP